MSGLLIAGSAYAGGGGGHVGGGNFTEAQLKDFMGELAIYFQDPQSKELFPEVSEWEKQTNNQFSDFIKKIEPKVVDKKVYGPFGEERDCVSMVDGDLKYFECNKAKLPEAKLENQPVLYAVLLHEAFIHAGIEKPTSEILPSNYPVSSRIGNTKNLSLVTYKKWVPGKLDYMQVTRDIRETGIFCSEGGDMNKESFMGLKKHHYLLIKPNGDGYFFKFGEPKDWGWYFGQQCQDNSGRWISVCDIWALKGQIKKFFDKRRRIKIRRKYKFNMSHLKDRVENIFF